ncbi:MAG: type III secretion inner membrane ring lipoprotein SctJ, partial [Limnobacter sp.]|nr:type III secretion inner membrane ring lipoprotein SctJ [Limnobacter sp.]
MNALRGFVFVVLLSLLSACSGDLVLFNNLSEEDGNEIYSTLLANGIPAQKHIVKEGINISVPEVVSNAALEVLKSKGLPRERTTSIGEVFKKDSMISTPLEERARYLYALSQELESTLMRIDGVLSARVHVVLPEQQAPGEPVQPSSAAVFVKFKNGSSFPAYAPKIKELVFRSIPGLTGDPETAVSIAAIPSEQEEVGIKLIWYGPMAIMAESRPVFL